MSNITINSLPTYSGSVDGVNDLIPIFQNSSTSTNSISRNNYLNIASNPVGLTDTQTLTNKTFTSPTISGPTLSGTIAGTYTIGGTPTFPSSVVQLTSTQTLTNKTLTSPTINGPTITNATLSADTITGYTTSNAGTIYGISVSGGQITNAAIANGTIGSTQIATNGVAASNLSTSAITLGYASITSNFTTTTEPGYVDVTSLAVTVTVPSGGRNVKITVFLPEFNTNATSGTSLTAAIREGSTVLGQGVLQQITAGDSYIITVVAYVAAPSAGSHTYKVSVAESAAGTITVGAGTSSSTTNPGAAFILVEAI